MNPPEGSPTNDPLVDMMRSWVAMASAVMPRPETLAPLAAAAGLSPGLSPGVSQGGGSVLAQAHLVAAGASMRAWTRSAQSLAQYQQDSSAAGAAGAEQAGRQTDAARAHLRRLGEIAIEEAHALDTQLQGLGEQLRAAMEDPAVTADLRQHRYARAKP